MRRHVALFCALAFAGAALDLLTKHLAFRHIGLYGAEVPVLPGWFSFGCTLNQGVIFGKFPGARTLWLVVSVAAVPAIVAIFFSVRKPRWILTITLGLILAGTIGNMYDRVSVGAVRDFIKVFYVRSDGTQAVWPLFNLADSYICVGVFLLTVEMVFFDEKKKKKPDDVPRLGPSPPAGPLPGPGPVAGEE